MLRAARSGLLALMLLAGLGLIMPAAANPFDGRAAPSAEAAGAPAGRSALRARSPPSDARC
jgi:hypothetical protein